MKTPTKFTEMLFIKYHGLADPITDKPLLHGVTYYAVPGGTVATKETCYNWGRAHDIAVSFSEAGWATK